MTRTLHDVWDEFFRSAVKVGGVPPGRGQSAEESRYASSLRALHAACDDRGIDPVDYIRTVAPLVQYKGTYMVPKYLMDNSLIKRYIAQAEARRGRSSAVAEWEYQEGYVKRLQQQSSGVLSLDSILACVSHPLSATFRLGCRATPPPPERMLAVYGQPAAREVQHDKMLCALLEKHRPWLLEILRERFGLHAEQALSEDSQPQPTRTLGPP